MGAAAIGPEHLLLGFLVVDQGEAMRGQINRVQEIPFLSGETAARLREAIVASASYGEPVEDSAEMSVSTEGQAALQAVASAAGSKITLLHILRGLLSDPECFVGRLLEMNGITIEGVDAAIREESS
jgi:hypothetical protein